jgi:DNA-binding response OmpR family regulator
MRVVGGNRTVLFLDDDEAIGALFERTAREAGFSVDVVTTEEQALTLGRSHPYALLVFDLALKTWNGLDILEQLAPAQPNAALVLVSAHFSDDRELQVEGRRVHMVAKPWRARALVKTLETALDQAPALARR